LEEFTMKKSLNILKKGNKKHFVESKKIMKRFVIAMSAVACMTVAQPAVHTWADEEIELIDDIESPVYGSHELAYGLLLISEEFYETELSDYAKEFDKQMNDSGPDSTEYPKATDSKEQIIPVNKNIEDPTGETEAPVTKAPEEEEMQDEGILKPADVHEGFEKRYSNDFKVKNKQMIATTKSAKYFKRLVDMTIGTTYKENTLEKIIINADGAGWCKDIAERKWRTNNIWYIN